MIMGVVYFGISWGFVRFNLFEYCIPNPDGCQKRKKEWPNRFGGERESKIPLLTRST